jgi:hypothetical protein
MCILYNATYKNFYKQNRLYEEGNTLKNCFLKTEQDRQDRTGSTGQECQDRTARTVLSG